MIDNINLDTGIFLSFLLLNLAVGLYYGRGVKTIKDYALGGRNFSTGALIATLVATCATGSGFYTTIAKTYSDGLHFVLISVGMAFSLGILGVFFIPRMGEFLGKLSVAEVMGDLYGNKVRVITAVAGTIGAAGLIAVQFKAFGNIFNYFLGLPPAFSVILAGGIVTIYSAFGGVRSVTFTDILQFVTFGVAIPLVGLLIWSHLHSAPGFSIIQAFDNPRFDYNHMFNLGNPKFWDMIPLLVYFMIPGFEPSLFQRFLIGKNVAQVKKAFIVAAILFLIIKLAMEWIPFLVYSVDPNLQPNELLSYIIDNYTTTGLKGLIIISITALAMSTADSEINASTVLFTHDICKQFNISSSNELCLSKIFALFFGSAAILLTFVGEDLLSIILFASSFYMPIVTVPLTLTIFGFRSSGKAVLIGMAAGFIVSMIWKIWSIEADGIIFATLANLLFLLCSHYLLKQPGGWTGIRDRSFLDLEKKERANKRAMFIQSVKDFNLLTFLRKHAPVNEITYTGFGIYCIIYTFTTMYSTQHTLLEEDGRIILTIYQIMLVTGVVMALYPIWPPRIKIEAVAQTWWSLAIFYMLTLFNMFFVLLSEFTALQFMTFTLNSVITITLLGWRFGTLILLSGSYLGLELFKAYSGSHIVITNIDTSAQAVVLYMLFVISAAVVIFLKPRQEDSEIAEEKIDHLQYRITDYTNELYKANEIRNEFLRNLQHEARTPITGITSMAQAVDAVYDQLPEEKRRQAIKDIAGSAERLESFVNNLVDLSHIVTENYRMQTKEVNLSLLVQKSLDKCRKLYIPVKEEGKREFTLDIEPGIMLSCDEYYTRRTIENIIINAVKYCVDGEIKISLAKAGNVTVLKVRDSGIGVPQEYMKDIFGAFNTSAKTKTPAGGRGVGLALAKKVMDKHKGQITVNSDGISWTEVECRWGMSR